MTEAKRALASALRRAGNPLIYSQMRGRAFRCLIITAKKRFQQTEWDYPDRMTDEELSTLADSWIRYHLAPRKSQKEPDAWAADTHDLEHHDPETLWLLILTVLQRDSSMWIQAVLSAGPVENLLVRFGPQFIDRIEVTAGKDPTFAHMLGGVWRASMNDDVWNRVQRIANKQGWETSAQKAS